MPETLFVERPHETVGLITLNRPKAKNALNDLLISELNEALDAFERDPQIGCTILTGGGGVFAAGADIREMQDHGFPQTYLSDFLNAWDAVAHKRKPILAAIDGYALGGGCELALMCDLAFASTSAQFGQPEIRLGIMPGAGGTQRLTRAIGKARAMDLCLTGRMMDAQEALSCGLVSRVLLSEELLPEALKAAQTIASLSQVAVMMTKESIQQSSETSLHEGLRFERRLFQSLFATQDQKEGMKAFLEKRPPQFGNC